MYNIQVYVPYEKQQYIKKMNHYINYYLPIIPSLPVPTPAPNWHTRTHTHTHTHKNMKQVAVGMYKSIRKLGGFFLFLG